MKFKNLTNEQKAKRYDLIVSAVDALEGDAVDTYGDPADINLLALGEEVLDIVKYEKDDI